MILVFRYILHPKNQGANIARNTGIRSSDGEIIAFLDQDDIFHSEKLNMHVTLLHENPEIGFTYNNRFNFMHSSTDIRGYVRCRQVTLPLQILY